MRSPQIHERVAVVTGAAGGIGSALASRLAREGWSVVLVARSPARAAPVRDAIQRAGGRARIVAADLADLDQVRAAAANLTGPIDVIVANAASCGARGVTRQGFELAFGVNHLAHYLLVRLLLPHTRRVVHLGSGSHARLDGIDWRVLLGPTRSRTGIREYATSKLAVALFHHALLQRGVGSFHADPGDVASDAWRHVPAPLRALWTFGMKSPERGAETPHLCATTDVPPGAYVDGRPTETSPLSRAVDLSEALWSRSAAWTGLAP